MSIMTTEEALDRFINLPSEANYDDLVAAWCDVGIANGEWSGIPVAHKYSPTKMEKSWSFPDLDNFSLESIHKEDSIREEAYYRWEAAGKPLFNEEVTKKFWLEAEAAWNELYGEKQDNTELELVNSWFSRSRQQFITIWKNPNTEERSFQVETLGYENRFQFLMDTYSTSKVWSVTSEINAQEKLRKHISNDQYKSYLLIGMFIEKSKKSNLYYLFRKNRPTIVISPNNQYKIIVVLCSHLSGYYQGTWAGVLPPTDDLIGNLFMMRHDEYNFWKKSQQYQPFLETAGI